MLWASTLAIEAGGSFDDSEYDLLLPTSVKWSSWRLSDCSEYNASQSAESESAESEQEVSGSESE